MQIQELEAELGVPLVERRPGEVAFTDIGREVARRAEQVLAATRDLADFARHRGRLLTGRLQLGVIPSIAPYVLPKILPVLQRRYPDLRVELRETQTRVLLEELHRGALDVIMLALPVDDAEIESSPVRRSVPARRAGDRQSPGERSRQRAGHRHAAADSAGGGPLPARPGAGVLLPAPGAT